MAVLPIVIGEKQPILRKKAEKVPRITKELLALAKDMQDTVKSAEGLGLAAPQIGRSIQLCLARINGKLTFFANPKITWRSKETDTAEEGCLCLPEAFVSVTRPVSIIVKYMNGRGKEEERKLEGLDARVVQHEVDHLNGVLIVDYILPTKLLSSNSAHLLP